MQAVFVLGSLAVHGGLLAALWETPRPLASIGVEAVSVDIVLGANMPTAGLAPAPGDSDAEQQRIDDSKPKPRVAEQQEATTASPQDIPVAERETAPPEQPVVSTEQEAARDAAPEQRASVAMVETPQAEMSTALPREAPPDITASIVPPPPEKKPVAENARPKQPAPKQERAQERKRIAARTTEMAHEQSAASEAKTLRGGLGAGRSDQNINYNGLVLAHLRRYMLKNHTEEGVPTVEFSFDGAGRVTSVRLAGSSGHPSLDQEVQALVRRASPFPPPPDGRPRNFRTPVRFAVRFEVR